MRLEPRYTLDENRERVLRALVLVSETDWESGLLDAAFGSAVPMSLIILPIGSGSLAVERRISGVVGNDCPPHVPQHPVDARDADGLIGRKALTIECRLADGYGEHYISINLREGQNVPL